MQQSDNVVRIGFAGSLKTTTCFSVVANTRGQKALPKPAANLMG
jgi:hypothetical protein